ncbi:Helix-turn-helix domain-containing protein [Ekhidna lutea]|uniref:Helix-turn-helix domain-containing protein n=1 Tax=Ekhidna lutea TaxID=447679 RepID=A0A239LLN6_EKHLU|nr:helix-turn-helix transcriptional regulator [Ekhidna lutea]SNT31210.1 Helix-turn-helix domain-containing protein [Ekhidna lutea]
MKQPELGKRLADLRQQKSMTQEELVEACNVSVRTIQRIESGEVTPRTSTVKILLSALGADLESFKSTIEITKSDEKLRTSESWLHVAWISGIVYFVLGFLDAALEYGRYENEFEVDSVTFYAFSKLLYFVSYSFFMFGLIRLGDYFTNYLLKITGYLMVGLFAIITFFDIFSIFYSMSEFNLMTLGAGESICVGATGIVFGIGLMRLQDSMGQLAKIAGIIEIVAGFFFAVVILFLLGYMMLVPATIIEIILLYKGYEFIKSERLKS